jgi:hypothetical protein
MNLVEIFAGEENSHASPCGYGNIVNGHACYCHNDNCPSKCPIWRKYGELDLSKWHNKGDWDELNWNGGCKYFIKNKNYGTPH